MEQSIMSGRPRVSSSRLQVVVSESLYDKIEAYSEMMGIGMTEAARHLMIRGLEQVQLLMSSKNSVDALNRMTQAFDRGLAMEEERESALKRPSKRSPGKAKKPVGGLVTPPQEDKNVRKSEKVKDMFNHD
jgi:hypothetical protein